MEKVAIFGILLIVSISVLSVVALNSMTGLYGSNYAMAPKLYGGGIRNAYAKTPSAFGAAYGKATMTARYQTCPCARGLEQAVGIDWWPERC